MRNTCLLVILIGLALTVLVQAVDGPVRFHCVCVCENKYVGFRRTSSNPSSEMKSLFAGSIFQFDLLFDFFVGYSQASGILASHSLSRGLLQELLPNPKRHLRGRGSVRRSEVSCHGRQLLHCLILCAGDMQNQYRKILRCALRDVFIRRTTGELRACHSDENSWDHVQRVVVCRYVLPLPPPLVLLFIRVLFILSCI